ncbi:putative protein kinase [Tetraselmis virus 1]|uniref:Protein kinase domain-containing protein n=1 Tax=Tetraselmis virus 1 TaxID=2060617 RepID=A0A2P0VN90_9VIRU|nr:putative protein kinase [Tetraselmis virus 1]AUF82353.1 putative protein kinase [Tetraselmis virus 1]
MSRKLQPINESNDKLKKIIRCKNGKEIASGTFGSVEICGKRRSRYAIKTFRPNSVQETKSEVKKNALEEVELNSEVIRRLGSKTRSVTLLIPDDSEINSETAYYFPTGDNCYIIYATCQGRSAIDLYDLQANKALRQDTSFWICGELSLKIRSLHKLGIYHNDIKRENVLACIRNRDGDTYIRLIDFGLSVINQSFSSSQYPGGTYKNLTPTLQKLIYRVLGFSDWKAITSLELTYKPYGKSFISDNRARDNFATVVTCCLILRGKAVDYKHPVIASLKRILSDLKNGDLNTVWNACKQYKESGRIIKDDK